MSHATPTRKRGSTELDLEGEAQEHYLRCAAAALGAARLSNLYPDARRLAAQLACLSPAVHHGLYAGLALDVRTGLPCYREWTRVQADQELAGGALAELPAKVELEQRARQLPEGIHGRRLLKHAYYTALTERSPVAQSSYQVLLRRVDPERTTAQFQLIFDKLDLSGLVVRTTVELMQQASVWCRPMVTLTEETAGQTEALRTMVYQMAGTDAELLFAQLAAQPGIQVERVIKGTIGPFFCRGVRVPVPLRPLVEDATGFVATFALDQAATDQPADRNNDPLADLLVETLTPAAQAAYVESRARYGYHVFKDRKLVVPTTLVEAVRTWCRESGTNNVVYTFSL